MGKILGVDFGDRRMGLAISDADGIIAMPLRTVEVASVKQACAAVRAARDETGAGKVVVGLPLNMNGSAGPMAEKAQAFAAKLEVQMNIPVERWDERLSTSLVERVLIDADMSRGKRKKVRDKLAAQVILQGYLDSRVTAEPDR